jgi:cytoskeletal protein RodZ
MLSAGEKLRQERVRQKLTIDEVAKATKIKPAFLLAIEGGEYKKLPAGTYAHGFIRNYAGFLGLSEKEILAVFKREYDEEKFLKVLPDGFAKNNDFPISRIKVANVLKILPLIVIILLAYLIFQYRSAIFNPSLSISTPDENAVITTKTIAVIGKTDSNATVFVNSEPADLDKNGNFKKIINVFPGKTKLTVKSVNSFNKVSVIERNIEVKMVY